ncbi:MAG TPA: CvpA family protein [Segetibacter sp.]|jgi:uncharacterized protein YkwD
MNYIDIILIIIVLLSVWSGWHKGFINGAIELLVMAGSLLAAFFLYPYLSAFFVKYIPSFGVWTEPLAFILIIIIARVLLSILVNRLLLMIPRAVHYNVGNKFLGLLPGFVNGLIYATIVAALLMSVPFSDNISSTTRESTAANKLAEPIEWLDEKLSPVFDEAVKKSISKLTVDPESKKLIELPFKVTDPKPKEELELKMLQLVNEERAKEGLKPLKWDPEMLPVARAHSADMFARSYFSHVSPEGKTPSDRIRAGKVRFLTAGENLALGPTLSICHTGLMNSPGHRANILHKSFGRVGIGILDGGRHGLMITQNFRN